VIAVAGPALSERVARMQAGRRRRGVLRGPRLVVLAVLLAAVSVTPRRGSAEPSQAAQRGIHLDGIAAIIGGIVPAPGVDVILHSDVDLHARLEQLATTGSAPSGDLPRASLASALNALVGEYVIAREARRLQVVRANAADLERERERLVASSGGPARLQALLDAHGVQQDEIEAGVRRRALCAAFLRANLEGSSAATRGELERWVSVLRARTPLWIHVGYE
jgi:hypothetical protein